MKQIIILGYGLVGKALYHLINSDNQLQKYKLIVIDKLENIDNLKYFYQYDINWQNFNSLFKKLLHKDDILIDLTQNTKSIDFLNYCIKNKIHYLSTADSSWSNDTTWTPYNHYLQYRLLQAKKLCKNSCLIEFGMNPGLISLFVKYGIKSIVMNDKNKYIVENKKELLELISHNKYAQVANLLCLETIVLADNDTSILKIDNYSPKTIYNNWSVYGLLGEMLYYSTIASNKSFNDDKVDEHIDNIVTFNKLGIQNKLKTWSPQGKYIGCINIHDEIFSLKDFLCINENNYCPNIMFSYHCCKTAFKKIKYIFRNRLDFGNDFKTIDTIKKGGESVGCILIGKNFKTRYIGNYLVNNVDLIKNNISPTIMQVAASCLIGLKYIITNPNQGLLFPEDLPITLINDIEQHIGKTIDRTIMYRFKKNI